MENIYYDTIADALMTEHEDANEFPYRKDNELIFTVSIDNVRQVIDGDVRVVYGYDIDPRKTLARYRLRCDRQRRVQITEKIERALRSLMNEVLEHKSFDGMRDLVEDIQGIQYCSFKCTGPFIDIRPEPSHRGRLEFARLLEGFHMHRDFRFDVSKDLARVYITEGCTIPRIQGAA
ncbi:hypothetical protein XM53_00950 [Roseovarius atlanticus]|uniref:Uncharacterized protein n=1 Tax=Roseovarius atlanticus TaxID=1641875 RepID=A0A0T5NZR3_9RHOB|nr:hypothetical protein [Roseovarius atlanticus]KRS14332.1 hypothetical protein XM53_00950 [Roseovarius atlanticus]